MKTGSPGPCWQGGAGDYKQYMDYSKYTQGQGSQGGASDYKKYMESYSGDYSKYMKGQSSQARNFQTSGELECLERAALDVSVISAFRTWAAQGSGLVGTPCAVEDFRLETLYGCSMRA